MMFDKEEINKIRYMYVTARQFKNVVQSDDLVPTPRNGFRNRVYPFIVNKSLSCEIYLKLILMATKKIEKRIHNLKELSELTNMDVEFKNSLLLNKVTISDEEFKDYLNNISNAFEDWRYIYEQKDIKLMYGFLNSFCDFLDEYSKKLMMKMFNIDADKELIYI